MLRGFWEGEGADALSLNSGLRKKKIVEPLKIFSSMVLRKTGYSGAEVARYLVINTSAVHRYPFRMTSRAGEQSRQREEFDGRNLHQPLRQ